MAALLDLRMPGVYTQEVATLPAAVGVIPSAVPVFIGYTEKAEKKGENLTLKPTRVKSMKEYQNWFGGPALAAIQVEVDDSSTNPLRPEVRVVKPVPLDHKMYYEMLFYYTNGGGPCYIMSVGNYLDELSDKALTDAIGPLKKVKEITILVFPDGTSLPEAKYVNVINAAFIHCEKMKNRVTIIDLNDDNDEDLSAIESNFQTLLSNDIDFKKYGMAYYPYLDTVFSYAYDRSEKVISKITTDATFDASLTKFGTDVKTSRKTYDDAFAAGQTLQAEQTFTNLLKSGLKSWQSAQPGAPSIEDLNKKLVSLATDFEKDIPARLKALIVDPKATDPFKAMDDALAAIATAITTADTATATALTAFKKAQTDAVAGLKGKVNFDYSELGPDILEQVNNLLYGKIKDAISNFPVKLPPCGAIAGIYVRVDATQGVWKAPANVSVLGAIKPTIDIDDDLHANLNAPSNGKAINVIRTYPGRGVLVYGGRTLAGNDLEWRYVNVRRTFCFIEDSVALAMQDFVFEPNNQQTWVRVKSMINNFLNRLWKAGGLYGSTPDDAYQVLLDIPTTMSVEEMLSGIMRIFIKVAVARPAEFIVLQYEHKFELAES